MVDLLFSTMCNTLHTHAFKTFGICVMFSGIGLKLKCVCKEVHIALDSKLTISLFSTQSRKNPAGDGIRTHDHSIPGNSLYH
jgi:hypothetical protein